MEAIPVEVLEKVVLALVDETLLGPPTNLPSLLRVSKTIHAKISITANPSLYSRIFARKFDGQPTVRRLGDTFKYASKRENELVKRFKSLKRFKFMSCRQFFTVSTAHDDLCVAYLLFLENDGQNYQQLVNYACVDNFSARFVQLGGPFHDGVNVNGN